MGWRSDPLRHHSLLSIIQKLEYDAIGIGDNEFIEGLRFYFSAIETYNLPVVSANIQWSDQPDWPEKILPFRIIQSGDLRVAILGFGDTGSFGLIEPEVRFQLQINSTEMLQQTLSILREQADLNIVLSHAELSTNRKLARRFPEIDVIIGSHSQRPLHEALVEDRTLLVQAGKNGAYVGQLALSIDRNKQVTSHRLELVPLKSDIPDDPEIRQALNAYHSTVRQLVEQTVSLSAEDIPFQGAENCRPCHEPQYNQWQTTAHAHAFQSLAADQKDNIPECLFCHTTGYGQPTGFKNQQTTPQLANVQCEVCHRVDERHGKETGVNLVAPVTSAICTECHTSVQSPMFHYEEAVNNIRH